MNEYLLEQQAFGGVVPVVHPFKPAFARIKSSALLDRNSSLKKIQKAKAHGGSYAVSRSSMVREVLPTNCALCAANGLPQEHIPSELSLKARS
jgi:hypothetical protein